MATSPVIVVPWLDPPLINDFSVGASVIWNVSFVDSVSRVLVDPDIVTFTYSNPPASTAVALTFPIGIVKDATGQYHYDLPLTTTGRWVLNVTAQGNPGAVQIGSSTLMITVYSAGV